MKLPLMCWLVLFWWGMQPTVTSAADRVLAMTISEYQREPLPGVRYDRDKIRQILKHMGVSSDHFRSATDRELTAEGIRRELEQRMRLASLDIPA